MEQQEKRSYLAYLDFKKGMLIWDLAKKHRVSPNTLYPYFKKFMSAETTRIVTTVSGHKSETYYSNEDDICADRVYNWDDLSDKEKSFYERYESSNKRQHT